MQIQSLKFSRGCKNPLDKRIKIVYNKEKQKKRRKNSDDVYDFVFNYILDELIKAEKMKKELKKS